MRTASRRQFIRRSTAALLAAPFISTSVTRALARESRPKLGWALCGLGSLSERQIAPALQKTEHCRLAGIVTGSPEKARRWRERYDIPERNVYSYDTIGEMAGNPDIDVVYTAGYGFPRHRGGLGVGHRFAGSGVLILTRRASGRSRVRR